MTGGGDEAASLSGGVGSPFMLVLLRSTCSRFPSGTARGNTAGNETPKAPGLKTRLDAGGGNRNYTAHENHSLPGQQREHRPRRNANGRHGVETLREYPPLRENHRRESRRGEIARAHRTD